MKLTHVWQRDVLLTLVRLVAGAYPVWHGAASSAQQRLYFSNHTSHIDTLAILAALPRGLRDVVRPVAARDYWSSGRIKRHIAQKLLNVVLIDRRREPEGTRGTEALPQAFRSGLFHLASEFPEVELTPVYLENLQRIMPKGAIWPIPLICKVHFGAGEARRENEDKPSFLARMRDAVIALAPQSNTR